MNIALCNKPLPIDPAFDFPYPLVKNPQGAGTVNVTVWKVPAGGMTGTSTPQADGTFAGQLSRQPDGTWQLRALGAIAAWETYGDNGASLGINVSGTKAEVFPYQVMP